MSKRGRGGDQLTGGSHDVNPQWLTMNLMTLSAANTFTESSLNVPITRFPQGKGRSLVLELLRVEVALPEPDTNFSAGGNILNAQFQLRPQSGTTIAQADPVNIVWCEQDSRGAFTAAGSYASTIYRPLQFDLTDGAGHGILVATDTLFMDGNTQNFAGAASFSCRILYRFKSVSLEEYIGIVQSQQ